MNFEKYFESRVNSEVKSRVYRTLFYLTFLICILLMFLNVYIVRNEKVILVPLNLPGAVTIKGNEVDPEYIRSLVYFFTSLLLTYDYQKVDEKFDLALDYFSEDSKEKYRSFFANEKKNIKLGQIVSYAEPLDILVDNKRDIVVFSVKRRLWSKGLEVEKGDPPVWYYLRYKVEHGSFKIIDFNVCQSLRCEQELGLRK